MSQQSPDRSTPARRSRPDASMSLLTNVTEHSLDEGYAEAAARRAAEGSAGLPKTLRSKLGLAAGLVLAAIVVTVGAAQARVEAPVRAKEREELISRIEDGTERSDTLERNVERLRREVGAAQREALEKHGGSREELTALLAGATPVHGPGLRLVVDDAESTAAGGDGPRESSSFADSGRVRDRDMQHVVNGLWGAGAEAVAINGQRLTAVSAIRRAGEAILVDNRPLAPPYTVLAVGDGQRLRKAFQNSAGGQYLKVLQDNYGVRASISAHERVDLPAAPSLIIRTAKPLGADGKSAADTGKGIS
ncbi:membrane protein [Streptomyces fradiae]|uniref:DUF881 domain-containing protein n=3 Tax=Streptomyces TaxID=1883 RepID=A0A3R7IPP3_9ACTN|nr:membrane protein [Streptomyces fradiae]OFA47807.1 hypothetical protein BEN35_19570 [Streptomyces fradiae]PQM21155.1 DUF881 domain-containing protein [Streptomyces xinghaiensis]RKM93521.1 DUF881 domain-containing protein [Streptomyces xinghaiensis]RNC71677.1 DUF881 domain-containing protein [Streptomyces xinghaiensis]